MDVLLMALPEQNRRLLEARMQRYEYRSDFARKYYGEGLDQGRQEGRQEGLRAAVVELARTKLEMLSEDDIAAIDSVADSLVLTELVASLGRAGSAVEARAALNVALAR